MALPISPKLPRWLEGGLTGGKIGLVGEVGPEPIMRGSSMIGMAGMNGPEVRQMPPGSRVVPHPSTLSNTPGLAAKLPASVAGAISRAMPGYADLLGADSPQDVSVAAPAPSRGDTATAALAGSVRALARAVDERVPPIAISGSPDPAQTRRDIRRALDEHQRAIEARRRWEY